MGTIVDNAEMWGRLDNHAGHELEVRREHCKEEEGRFTRSIVCLSCEEVVLDERGSSSRENEFSAAAMRRRANEAGRLEILLQDVLEGIRAEADKGATRAALYHMLPSWRRVRALGLSSKPKEEDFIPMLETLGYKVTLKREVSNGVLQDPMWFVCW